MSILAGRLKLTELRQQVRGSTAQGCTVGLDDAPYTGVVDLVMAMHQHIAESHDTAEFREACGQLGVDAGGLAQASPMIAN
jgi:hypothetical protein